MKNIKLLLATTAMLSMGAMAANADNSGQNVTINPKVTMVTHVEPRLDRDLNFGKVSSREGTTLTVSPSYNTDKSSVDVGISGNATYFGGAQAGRIYLNTPNGYDKYELVLPTEIVLSTTHNENTIECGRATNFTQASEAAKPAPFIWFGATYTVSKSILDTSPDAHECSGEGIVTLVLKSE